MGTASENALEPSAVAERAAGKHKVGKRIAIVLAVLVVVFFVASFAVDRYMLNQTFAKHDQVIEPGGAMPTFEDYARNHTRTPIEFTMDGQTLRGYIYESPNPKGFVVFRHGIYANHGYYLPMIMALVDRGWTVMAYDAYGAGISDGDNYISMSQSAIDVARMVVNARAAGYAGDLPIVLWGHSWGGYGVAAALAQIPWVKACVTMSGFDEPFGIVFESAQRMVGGIALTQAPTLWLNMKLDTGDALDMTAVAGINSTDAPVLVIHGTNDETVSYDKASIIAHRDRITNDKVEYYEPSEKGRNGHNTYFYSAESNAYGAEKRAELAMLDEQYPDGIPDDVRAAFFADYDVLRANTPDPVLMNKIDEFLTRAIGGTDMVDANGTTTQTGAAKQKQYGELTSVMYSNSGNSLGNLYSLETETAGDGTLILVEKEAAMHSDPTTIREYKVPADLLDQVTAIVDEAGIKTWGELEPSEFIPLDASTPSLRLRFTNADPDDPWPPSILITRNDVMPDDGKALWAIRDLLAGYATDENLIREYSQPVRY